MVQTSTDGLASTDIRESQHLVSKIVEKHLEQCEAKKCRKANSGKKLPKSKMLGS